MFLMCAYNFLLFPESALKLATHGGAFLGLGLKKTIQPILLSPAETSIWVNNIKHI